MAAVGIAASDAEVRFCALCRAVYHADFARCPNDGGTLEIRSTDPLIGTTIAQYAVDAFIGGGAMGRVYRCHHTKLTNKPFAVKVLRGDLAATMAMRLRFTQEAEAASRLVHPNVISVIDFGRTEEGLLYLAMDFVEGDSLAAIIAGGRMTPLRVVRIARQLCKGLAHAHELGFVHRDLKPDNVIVVSDGEREKPRIVDFGLAVHADPDAQAARVTQAGTTVGTPAYAAPEQMSSSDVDGRADLFALGVTMFEMLAGRLPFDGNVIETIHHNAASPRPAISRRAPDAGVPRRLEALVQRLMAIEPEERPATANEVREELEAIERELGGSSMRLTITPVAGTKIATAPTMLAFDSGAVPVVAMRRRRWWIAAGTLGVAALASGAFVATRPDGAKPARVDAPRVVAAATPTYAAPRLATAPPAPPPTPSLPPATAAPPHVHHHAAHVAAPERLAPEVPAAAPLDAGVVAPVDAAPVVPDVAIVVAPVQVARPVRIATSARVAIESLSVRGSLTTAQIRRAIDRVTASARACYGPAAKAAASSPSVSLSVRFVVDETQRARQLELGPSALPGLAPCVTRALASLRAEAAPDVGDVDVAFVLRFDPELP